MSDSDDIEDEDAPGPLDGVVQGIPSGLPSKKEIAEAATAATAAARRPRARAPRVEVGGQASAALAALLERVGPPPLDPVGNSAWANNVSALLAHFALTVNLGPLDLERIKLAGQLIDRIGVTQSKAVTAGKIQELQRRAGLGPAETAPKPPGSPATALRTGRAVRAKGRG